MNNYNYYKENAVTMYYDKLDMTEVLKTNIQMMTIPISESAKAFFTDNYQKAQERVVEIKATGENKTEFFPGMTYRMHDFLYSTIFRFMLAECTIIAILLTFFSLHYEGLSTTSQMVFSSKRGRKIVEAKLKASLTAVLIFATIIFSITLTTFFMIFPYKEKFFSYISSAMATETRGIFRYPFITWQPFTILQYLIITIVVSYAVILVITIISGIFSLLIKNSYVGVLVVFSLLFVWLSIFYSFHTGTMLDVILYINPYTLMTICGGWFMEHTSPFTSYPHFELIIITVWTFIGLVGWNIAKYFYYRSDLRVD